MVERAAVAPERRVPRRLSVPRVAHEVALVREVPVRHRERLGDGLQRELELRGERGVLREEAHAVVHVVRHAPARAAQVHARKVVERPEVDAVLGLALGLADLDHRLHPVEEGVAVRLVQRAQRAPHVQAREGAVRERVRAHRAVRPAREHGEVRVVRPDRLEDRHRAHRAVVRVGREHALRDAERPVAQVPRRLEQQVAVIVPKVRLEHRLAPRLDERALGDERVPLPREAVAHRVLVVRVDAHLRRRADRHLRLELRRRRRRTRPRRRPPRSRARPAGRSDARRSRRSRAAAPPRRVACSASASARRAAPAPFLS